MQGVVEDTIIMSDMERLNVNQVLLASSKRNEDGAMKLVDLKQEVLFYFFSFASHTHTCNVNFLLQNTVDVKKFTRIQRETGQAHRRKILVLPKSHTHLTKKVLRYS